MVNKMYSIMNKGCIKASKLVGITINFPKPSKHSWKITSLTNGILGTILLLVGIFSPYKWVLLLGLLGILGSLIASKQ